MDALEDPSPVPSLRCEVAQRFGLGRLEDM